MNEKIHISWSEIADFLSCNFKHYLGYTKKLKGKSDNIHLIFGTAIHSTIENYLNKTIKKEEIIAEFNKLFATQENILKFNIQNILKFQKQGITILTEFSNSYAWENIEILHTEFNGYTNIHSNFYFKYKIDLVYKYNGIVYIADYKTSTDEWNKFKYENEYYGWQLLYYKYFFSKETKIPLEQIKTCYIVLNRNESEKTTSKIIDFVLVDSNINKINTAISKLYEILNIIYGGYYENYLRKNATILCNWCEFSNTAYCEGYTEKTKKNYYKTTKNLIEKIEKTI